MLSLDDLSQALAVYEGGGMSLDEFSDWFRAVSRGKFGEDQSVLDACLEIEAALSELYYGAKNEQEFREELATAIRPFALSGPVYAPARRVVFGEPQQSSRSVNRFYRAASAA
jgi:hypothetical protein